MKAEHPIGGKTYRIGALTPRQQFHILRRLAPVAASVAKIIADNMKKGPVVEADLERLLVPLTATLNELKDEDADHIINNCLGVCQRQEGTKEQPTWAPVMGPKGQLMFADIRLPEMMQLVIAAITENLGSFFDGGALTAPATGSGQA